MYVAVKHWQKAIAVNFSPLVNIRCPIQRKVSGKRDYVIHSLLNSSNASFNTF